VHDGEMLAKIVPVPVLPTVSNNAVTVLVLATKP
jgi:hypothetical protein